MCSNDETFLIDSTLNTKSSSSSSPNPSLSRFGAFYLTSPGYPNEYANNLVNCSCRLEYVRIENSPSLLSAAASTSRPIQSNTAEISLAISAYEFDLEEEEAKCNKDYFRITSNGNRSTETTLCGHHKEFNEFYSNGRTIELDFKSDDFITRRGFLFKISTIPSASQCPQQSHRRFDSTRCVSVHHERPASWSEAQRQCSSRGGRILALNDFVDAMRMNAAVRGDNDISTMAIQYWVQTSNRKSGGRKCGSSRSVTGWHEERSCSAKRGYICEYATIRRDSGQAQQLVAGMSDTNGNRLIRVACGQPSVATQPESSSRPTTTRTSTKLIPSNSILNTQRPQLVDEMSSSRTAGLLPAVILDSMVAVNDKGGDYDEYDESLRDPATTTTSSSTTTTTATSTVESSRLFGFSSLTSQDYLLIIAVVSGIAIVLVAINVFCIWNYYKYVFNSYLSEKSIDFILGL